MRLIHQDTEVQDPGDTAGDYAAGREFSRRATWETGDPDHPYLTVEVTAYTEVIEVAGDGDGYEDSYYAGEEALALPNYDAERGEGMEPGRYHRLTETASTWVCYHDEPGDPGDSEITSDYEYEEIGYTFCESLEESQAYCRDYIASLIFKDDGTVR